VSITAKQQAVTENNSFIYWWSIAVHCMEYKAKVVCI